MDKYLASNCTAGGRSGIPDTVTYARKVTRSTSPLANISASLNRPRGSGNQYSFQAVTCVRIRPRSADLGEISFISGKRPESGKSNELDPGLCQEMTEI